MAVPPEATVAALKEEIHRLRPELPSVKLFSVQLGEDALKDSDGVGSLRLASGAGLFAIMEEAHPYAAIVAKMRLWSAFDDGVVFTYRKSSRPVLCVPGGCLRGRVGRDCRYTKDADQAAYYMLTFVSIFCGWGLIRIMLVRICALLTAAGEMLAFSCRCLQVPAGDSRTLPEPANSVHSPWAIFWPGSPKHP